ncbi:hypothetical protein AMS68_003287 [Peltaster fructicola]|uniref:mitogen-activated protein kinase kinase kinase n=1 Tax=Peltaster fructicola TaxID=286661 RepID=A0A6H0XTI2_9PEZI|nr:hypothetical protein AMS68_003287 [Peltaster fructicola]
MSQPHYRVAGTTQPVQHAHNMFTSPTESEFSESYRETPDTSAQEWDEARVSDWLKDINCAQYIELFRRNNITGENLMDMDQNMLKEIGVKKIGDRVRLGTQVKVLRSNIYKRGSKRSHNRNSLAILDGNAQFTPPSSGSPRTLHVSRPPGKLERRISRQYSGDIKALSRPVSPMVDQENRARTARNGMPSPLDPSRKDPNAYIAQPARYIAQTPRTQIDTPQTARFATVRSAPSLDNINTTNVIGALPNDKPLIRVIYDNGTSSVVDIGGFRNAEDIVKTSLRKGGLNENHVRSYCFYVLDGTDPDPAFCRRISEAELVKLSNDRVRSERGRLLLRKIHAGTPDGDQLRAAARIAEQQLPSPPAIEVQIPSRNKKGVSEPLQPHSYPLSPASEQQLNTYFETQSDLSRNVSVSTTASARARKLKDFYGARPPTELITQDLQSYFPEVAKEEMDRTVRMSVRRSVRMSKALSRLSIASNISMNSMIDKDAPPIPSIADSWLAGSGKPIPRPLSVVRLAQASRGYRDSIASSMLEPLDEESPLEPNRKSYVSMSGDDGSDGLMRSTASINDAEGSTVMQPYYDGNSSPEHTEGGSFNSRLSQFIAEDGEEPDEELMQHLEKDNWDDLKYMKGAMIGQGSFGTVFLALHAVTAELMAVKQVEMPSSGAMDAKKTNMVEALKHEISLLKELKHPNIVRYLGSNSDNEHLNIFLEYVAGGSVATMLVNYGSLNELLICNFVRQILAGLNYLHCQEIIHRDIKGANILVDNMGTVKISDFGISKRVEASTLLSNQPKGRGGPRVSLQGSVFWMAPEVVRQTAYTKKADIWSLGCLVVEMFTGSHPHPNLTQLQALFKIGHSGVNAEAAKPDLPEGASKAAKDFLSRTFEIEHEKRPTAAELLVSEFCMQKV